MVDEWSGDERREGNVTLSDVHAGIVEVAQSMTRLAEAITRSARNRSVAQSVWLGLLTVAVVVVGGIGLRNGSIASDSRAIAQSAQDTNRQIQDCTTPGGECFNRNLAIRNAAAVKAVAQFECDNGKGCVTGITPSSSTTTTTTTTAPPPAEDP